MNYGARAALLVIHKNKAFDCHLKLYKMNFFLLEQYKNKQSNQKYKCTQKICVNDFKSKLNMHSTYVWTIKSNPIIISMLTYTIKLTSFLLCL